MNMTKGKQTSVVVVATTALLLALAASSATADLPPRRALTQQQINDDGATPFPPCTAEDDGVIEYHARFHVEVKPAGLDLGYLSDALVSAATGLSKENIMMMPQSNMTNDDGGRRGNGGRGGGRPGRGHRGLLMSAVDECSVEEAATAEKVQVEVHSADQAALLALKDYVESGEFEQDIVEGAACYAGVRARGGELEIKEVDPCTPPRRDNDDEGTHRRPRGPPRRDGH